MTSSWGAGLEPSSIKFRLGARYNSVFNDAMAPQTGWAQWRTTIDYNLGLASTPIGDFTLQGEAGTGRNYTVSWNSFATTLESKTVPDQVFNMRKIYLQDVVEGWVLQGGVIPPNSGDIPTVGYDVDGWLQGGRVVAPVLDGNVQVATGVLANVADPNAFKEWASWNYFSLKAVQQLPWELQGSLSYEYIGDNGVDYLQDSNYVGAELTRKWTLDDGIVLKGGLEAIHNFSQPSWAGAAAVSLKLKPVTIKLRYTYINPNFGLRGELSNDYFVDGNRVSINFGGDIPGVKNLKWFANTDLTDTKSKFMRIRAGLTYGFGASEAGYLALFD
ncbi:MAG: hypothetical protein ACQKBW_03190 [Puniceicoccales bacterium]